MTRLIHTLALLALAAGPALAQDVQLFVTPATTTARSFETIPVSIVVANQGTAGAPSLQVSILLPGNVRSIDEQDGLDCPGASCDDNEVAVWTVGRLEPGQARTLTLPISPDGGIPDGSTLAISATGAGQSAQAAIRLDEQAPMAAALTATVDAVQGRVTYVLDYANRSGTPLAGATVGIGIPEGTALRSASPGGTESSGAVVWSVGSMREGEGGRLWAVVDIPTERVPGSLLIAGASAQPAGAPQAVGARATVAYTDSPLQLSADAGQAAANTFETSPHRLVVANRGPRPLTAVSVAILLPDEVLSLDEQAGLDCPGTRCEDNEVAVWSVGTLEPGQAQTLALPVSADGGVRDGRLLTTSAHATAADGEQAVSDAASTVFRADPAPGLSASLHLGDAVPGGLVTATLTVGNRSDGALGALALSLPVPDGLVFESASTGGTLAEGDPAVVSWALGPFGEADGGRVFARFRVAAGIQPGTLLRAHAAVRAAGTAAHAATAASVTGEPGLALSFQLSAIAAPPFQTVAVTLTATNQGPSTSAPASVAVLIPDEVLSFDEQTTLDCPGSRCEDNEIAVWSVGALAPGQSQAIAFPVRPDGGGRPARILSAVAYLTAAGASPAAQADVLVGAAVVTGTPAALPAGRIQASAFPTPFSDRLTLQVHLDRAERAAVHVYDLYGRLVATLHDGPLPGGRTRLDWSSAGLASGLYVYRVATPSGVATGTVVKATR
ncbi:T9SS type A sorting domain-containing protein [Rubrivirga sp. IMCC43871]|uniref:T9SS type A sorting domain-containing protein n=1 Tax=Rubrivirga sp. IMCC43871 TaxID=3391575 RepID=UPI00398F912B